MRDDITRRDALGLALSAAAFAATGAAAQTPSNVIEAADVAAPPLPIEKGASLRMLRPVRFVQPDEDVFRANAKVFTDKTGVEVKVDFVGWEDINRQTAVTANSGAGPDIIIGFSDAPHIYFAKLIELTDVADNSTRDTAAGSRWRCATAGRTRAPIGSVCPSALPAAR